MEEEVSPQVHNAFKGRNSEGEIKKDAGVLRAAAHRIQGKPKMTPLAHKDFNAGCAVQGLRLYH